MIKEEVIQKEAVKDIIKEEVIQKEAGKDIIKDTSKEIMNKECSDISFMLDIDTLGSIMGFMGIIDNKLPIEFYKDKIFIHQKSYDNVQYAEISIPVCDLVNYDPRLKLCLGTNSFSRKRVVLDISRTALDRISTVYDVMAENKFFGTVGDKKLVRVNIFNDKAEFELPGNIVIKADVLQDEGIVRDVFKGIERLPALISKIRNDSALKKSTVTLYPKEINRICCERHNSGNYDISLFLVKLDKDGMTLFSKSRDDFYELKLKPKYMCLEIDDSICDKGSTIYMDIEYMKPYCKIVDPKPVIVEVRNDRPIVLETKLLSDIKILLTIAPRVISEKAESRYSEGKGDLKKMTDDIMDF